MLRLVRLFDESAVLCKDSPILYDHSASLLEQCLECLRLWLLRVGVEWQPLFSGLSDGNICNTALEALFWILSIDFVCVISMVSILRRSRCTRSSYGLPGTSMSLSGAVFCQERVQEHKVASSRMSAADR